MINETAGFVYDLVMHYGFWGILLLMLIENIGFPAPTEVGFIIGQTMVLSGDASYLGVFSAILIGKTLGSLISYYIGKYFAGRARFIDKNSSRLKYAQVVFLKWMKKYGTLAVFISRLVGYIRPWSSYLAGLGGIGPIPFIIYNITGSAVIILINMLFLGGVVQLWKRFTFLQPAIAVLSLLSFFIFWIIISLYLKKHVVRKTDTPNDH